MSDETRGDEVVYDAQDILRTHIPADIRDPAEFLDPWGIEAMNAIFNDAMMMENELEGRWKIGDGDVVEGAFYELFAAGWRSASGRIALLLGLDPAALEIVLDLLQNSATVPPGLIPEILEWARTPAKSGETVQDRRRRQTERQEDFVRVFGPRLTPDKPNPAWDLTYKGDEIVPWPSITPGGP